MHDVSDREPYGIRLIPRTQSNRRRWRTAAARTGNYENDRCYIIEAKLSARGLPVDWLGNNANSRCIVGLLHHPTRPAGLFEHRIVRGQNTKCALVGCYVAWIVPISVLQNGDARDRRYPCQLCQLGRYIGNEKRGLLLEMDDLDWHDTIDINLTGTANAIRAFAPAIVKRGGGRIIVTSSTQGQHGTLNASAYSASKWGIIGLMKSAALELGKHKVTVNALIPGLIDTALTRHEGRYAQAIRSSGEEPTGDPSKDEKAAAEGLAAKLPMGVPWLEPDQMGPAAVFLASDAAAMISGTSLAVTGGDSANVTA